MTLQDKAEAVQDGRPPEPVDPSINRIRTVQGYVDFYGYHSASGSWFVCGWMKSGLWPSPDQQTSRGVITFETGSISGDVDCVLHYRDDLGATGVGFVAAIQSSGRFLGPFLSITFQRDDRLIAIFGSEDNHSFRGQELEKAVRGLLTEALSGTEVLRRRLSRQSFAGKDTIDRVASSLLMGVDELIRCGHDGALMIGWLLAEPGAISSIRIRSGELSNAVSLEHAVRLARPDLEEVGASLGLSEPKPGFMAYLPNSMAADEVVYLEIETASGDVVYKTCPTSRLRGMEAIRRILGAFDLRYGEMEQAFDHVIGPAIGALNAERLSLPRRVDVLQLGERPASPSLSVIVPIYGRIDFLEYQMALFSANPDCRSWEFLYVLDDPPKRRAFEVLAESVYARFEIPFTVLMQERNLGYGPTNNAALSEIRGDYVCFLNSDVFPGDLDWLPRLAQRLRSDPTLGAIGPLLVFEDGSVQHEGIEFRPIPQFSDWSFPIHTRKGYRPRTETNLRAAPVITAACLVMPRDLAVELKGFDEAYIIGDFEDSDLCLRIGQAGRRCFVDPTVRLYHLERKSQADPSQVWRMNLTLYNAWFHQRRWLSTGRSSAMVGKTT